MSKINKNQLPFPELFIPIDGPLIKKLGIVMMNQEDIMNWLNAHKYTNDLYSTMVAPTYMKHLSYMNLKKYVFDSAGINHKDFNYMSSPALSYKELVISIQYYWEICRQVDPCNAIGSEQYQKFLAHYTEQYNTIKEHLKILGLHRLSSVMNEKEHTRYYGVPGILDLCSKLDLKCPEEFKSYCLNKKLAHNNSIPKNDN